MGAKGYKIEFHGGRALEKILINLKKANINVKAGIFEGATTTDGQNIPEYAFYNEFGTARIPARPFLRRAANNHFEEWLNIFEDAFQNLAIDSNAVKDAAYLVGEKMKSDIKDSIQNGEFAPNAETTVEAKKKKGKTEPGHPLIDTGQMLAAVGYEVIEE